MSVCDYLLEQRALLFKISFGPHQSEVGNDGTFITTLIYICNFNPQDI